VKKGQDDKRGKLTDINGLLFDEGSRNRGESMTRRDIDEAKYRRKLESNVPRLRNQPLNGGPPLDGRKKTGKWIAAETRPTI